MAVKIENYLEEKIRWRPGSDPIYPYVTDFEGERCLIRMNDFPDDHLYTLIVDDQEVASFDDWPGPWNRP